MNRKILLALTPFIALACFSLFFQAYSSDEYAYLTTGKAFAENTLQGYTDLGRFPLYSFTLSILFRIFGYGELIARLFSIALGIFGIILTFKLAKELFNEEKAFFAALIVSTNPLYTYLTTRMLSEALFLVLFMGSLIVLLKAKNYLHYAFFGVLAGLTFLTRYFGGYLLFVALLYAYFTKKLNWKNYLLIIIGFIIALSPWMAWSASETGSAFGFGLSFLTNQLSLNENAFSLPDKIPLYALGLLGILCASSILLVKNNWKKTNPLLLASIIGVWISMEAYGFLGNPPLIRYLLPVIPVLAVLVSSIEFKGSWKKILIATLVLNLIAGVFVINYFGNNAKYVGYREAGLFAAENCDSIDSNIQRIIEHYSGKRNTLNGECIVSSDYDGKLEIPSNYLLVFEKNGVNVYQNSG
ncbi:glycosyltransferase family 39 protein [Candidatus Micrarchaeota archaeon]|nr:glycosyltransferase family 39 protein [Candidatus Micrarchaeota archaeon]